MHAYCFRCKNNKPIKNLEYVTMKNGRPASRGVCPTCGTKLFRIGKIS